jgi:hypothetical protein
MTGTRPYTGKVKIIDKKDPNQAHRALVWMMNTDGKSIVLKRKAKLFAGAILQSRMQRYDVTTAYIASIGYPPLFQSIKNIQSPAVCASLQKMPINRNVAHAIVFGPKRLGGMSLRHLHTLQGIQRGQYFIGHIANNDGVGKLIRICIKATQLKVCTFFILSSLHPWKYNPNCLIVS